MIYLFKYTYSKLVIKNLGFCDTKADNFKTVNTKQMFARKLLMH